MKRHLFAAAITVASVVAVAPAAAAPIVINYQLNNVTFLDGGTAFGSISVAYDPNPFNTFSNLLAVDVTTTAGSLLAGTHYTNLNNWGTGTAGPSALFGQVGPPFITTSFLQISTPDQANILYLSYDQSIPVTANATLQLIGTNQIPGEWNLGTRRAYGSGSLVPVTEVPEPASWAVFLGGLLLTFFFLRSGKFLRARD